MLPEIPQARCHNAEMFMYFTSLCFLAHSNLVKRHGIMRRTSSTNARRLLLFLR